MISGNALDASLLEKLFQSLVPDAFDHSFISPVFLHRVDCIVSRDSVQFCFEYHALGQHEFNRA